MECVNGDGGMSWNLKSGNLTGNFGVNGEARDLGGEALAFTREGGGRGRRNNKAIPASSTVPW